MRDLCRFSNNLYNVALSNIRRNYFSGNGFFRYEKNYHVCKCNENYIMLQASVAQQTIRSADKSFRSYLALKKKCKNGEYLYKHTNPPKYRPNDAYYNLMICTNAIIIKDGYFKMPISRKYRENNPNVEDIYIPYPDVLNDVELKEVIISPSNDGREFYIRYIYIKEYKTVDVDYNNIMAIDLGVDNFATCTSNVEMPFIMDGKMIKSINRYWNKEMSRLGSIANKQGQKMTHRMERITARRNNRVNDIIKKTAKYIVDNCIEYKIGTVIVGYNKNFKKSVNLGSTNNQNFVQIPYGNFRKQLNLLCNIHGIEYIEQEESYTSKCSYVDGDIIPTYKLNSDNKFQFSGQRISRGLYKSKNGMLINADVNASANIGKKCKQNFVVKGLSSGLAVSPKRIKVL